MMGNLYSDDRNLVRVVSDVNLFLGDDAGTSEKDDDVGIRIENGSGILLIIPDQYDFDSDGNRIKKGGMAAQFSTSATAHFGDKQQVSVSDKC